MDIRDQIITLGHTLSEERNSSFDLWTYLPSYKEAEKFHGDASSNFIPSVNDIIREATHFFSHNMAPTEKQIKEAGELYMCPCGEEHIEDTQEEEIEDQIIEERREALDKAFLDKYGHIPKGVESLHVYRPDFSPEKIIVQGKSRMVNDATLWTDKVYNSPIYENMTLLDLFYEFDVSIGYTGDDHHIFLEGTKIITDVENGEIIQLIKVVTGS